MESFESFKKLVIKLWDSGEFESRNAIAEYLYETEGIFHYSNKESMSRSVRKIIQDNSVDEEILVENVKLAKSRQKLQDTNRIERKTFREYARIENAVSEYGKELNKSLKLLGKSIKLNLKPIGVKGGGTGVIQITDVHANELINLPHNKYNFDILSRRLKKLISESLEYFKFKGVEDVVMAFTGDLLNSDRRLDELLNMATNRSKASVLASHLFIQAILDVAQHYPVKVVSVLGNESRVSKEMTFSNEAFSDNYDFTIMAMAKEVIEASSVNNVVFHSIDQMESVVNFGEQRWLVAHDITKMTDKQAKTQSSIGRYRLQGINIDFIIGGHIHAFRATDISCRSGSMTGSNSYNENALNLAGRASGVCYVVKGKSRSIQYIDLQDYDNEGYEFESKLEAYNVKSHQKCKQNTRIMEIVI